MVKIIKLNKSSKLLTHIIAWAVIFFLPYIFASAYYDEVGNNFHDHTLYLSLNTTTKIFWVALFYLNTEILISRFIYAKKYILFALLQLIMFSVIMLVHGFLFKLMISGHTFNFFRSSSHNTIAFLFSIIVSIAYKTISDKSKADAQAVVCSRLRQHLPHLQQYGCCAFVLTQVDRF